MRMSGLAAGVRRIILVGVAVLLIVVSRRGAAQTCAGDCNGDGLVVIAELITVVNVALELQVAAVCVAGDGDGDGAIAIGEIVAGVAAALEGCATAPTTCSGATYTYTFTNYCAAAIFIGQNGPGTASTPPSFPAAGNWAIAPACTVSEQAAICTGMSSVCQVPGGQQLGQCTCSVAADCPGSAPCTGGLCSTATTFCMPQNWSSGVFWPRTGCELSAGDLNCATGQCGGDTTLLTGGRLDCGAAGASGGQSGPTAPALRFEPTTTVGGVFNYDVSVINGFNVETSITVLGGADCPDAGCSADLNSVGQVTSCPTDLVFLDPRGSGTPVGCNQPADVCLNSGAGTPPPPPAGLLCTSAITTDALGNPPAATVACDGGSGTIVTYLDMYEAKNTADTFGTPTGNNTQATTNGGNITAFSAADCPPGTEFSVTFVATDPTPASTAAPGVTPTPASCAPGQTLTNGMCQVLPPPGTGVCLQFQGGVLVPNWGCSARNIGTPCGQYATSFSDALGYTCQAVTYSGGTAYPCLPSTLSGLGTCQAQGTTEGFYPGVGGGFNASWVQAGIQAGGGTTPYYETFKAACPGAYVFQYDDESADYGCSITPTPSSGFAVAFCASAATPGGSGTPTPTPTATGTSAVPPTVTATATATLAIPTGTATATATAGSATLTWIDDGASSTSITIPQAGMSYTATAPLLLNDAQMRFCTTSGLQPIASVDFGGGTTAIIGATTLSTSQINVANVPAATTPGTYDVLIQTNPDCGSMTTLTMRGAITYQ